ncbi:hypothetical protein ACFYWY_37680 [Streptomyces sp. NPDC002870]|uniref:hypothetical protein n=1 Tax=Streptomyces sp. NPDC002870 TaxID=3364666 RepID=UPI00369C1A5C
MPRWSGALRRLRGGEEDGDETEPRRRPDADHSPAGSPADASVESQQAAAGDS